MKYVVKTGDTYTQFICMSCHEIMRAPGYNNRTAPLEGFAMTCKCGHKLHVKVTIDKGVKYEKIRHC